MTRQAACLVVTLLVACCGLSGMAQRRSDFLLFTDPGRRFSVEFPKDWSWMIVAGSGDPLATFVQPRKEAAVVVERFHLKQRLAPGDVTDLFAQIESDYVKENQPRATDIVASLSTRSGRRIVVIDYTRPGLGERERVRQYSFPIDQDLYRVTCMALMSQFARYESTFAEVAESLKSADALGPR